MAEKPNRDQEGYKQLNLHPEERLHLIEENVRDYALFMVDPEGRIASWNLGAERIFGYTEDEAISMNCVELFTPEDREQGAHLLERKTAEETGRATDERWHLKKDHSRFWGSGVMTGVRDETGTLRGYFKILQDETARRMAEEANAAAQELRAAQERQNILLQERTRIAQEIHDTLAQALTGINIQLENAEDVLTRSKRDARKLIARAKILAQEGLAEARRSVWAMRPQILENGGLLSVLNRLSAETTAHTSLVVHFQVQGTPLPLKAEIENQLLRVCQEAITNVLRYAEATTVDIQLVFADSTLRLRIQDDGKGFDPDKTRSGFGLTGMRERVESLGGEWMLLSQPGQGTRIEGSVPLS